MKSRHCPSPFFLIWFLCAFGILSATAWGAVPPQSSGSVAVGKPASSVGEATIPGPLRSFLRMTAISQKISPDEVLPLLARNVVVIGYQNGKPTQFLILVNWYLDQARELEAMAGPQGVIHIPDCDHVKPLLLILGYRMREPCGPDAALETADANRAFLTIDSGFPLADLEDALRSGKPFDTPYVSAKVPVLSEANRWILNEKNANKGVVDSILRDPLMARLYWGLSRMDTETANFLWDSLGQKKLMAGAPILDFYGSHISVRSGRVLVPGGTAAEPAWKNLVGASPNAPADFVGQLLVKDEGWLAAYFDALSAAWARRSRPTLPTPATPAVCSVSTKRFADKLLRRAQPNIPSGRTRDCFSWCRDSSWIRMASRTFPAGWTFGKKSCGARLIPSY